MPNLADFARKIEFWPKKQEMSRWFPWARTCEKELRAHMLAQNFFSVRKLSFDRYNRYFWPLRRPLRHKNARCTALTLANKNNSSDGEQ